MVVVLEKQIVRRTRRLIRVRKLMCLLSQGRFTAHRHQVLALATVQAVVFDIPHLVRVATPEHLSHQAIIVTDGVSLLQTR